MALLDRDDEVRRPALPAIALSALMLPSFTAPASARGPDGIADVAERVIDAVVNISTSQNVASRNQGGSGAAPNLPNDPQLDELFRDFFNRRGQQGDNQNRGGNTPRRVNSLGSGFIIDSAVKYRPQAPGAVPAIADAVKENVAHNHAALDRA